MGDLAALIRPELVYPELPGVDRQSVLRAISQRIAEAGLVPDAEALYRGLLEREELGSTAVGTGVAIPHCKLDGLREVLLSVARCSGGVDFDAKDDLPVRLLFTVVSPAGSPAAHLQSLSLISRWIQANSHVESILAIPDVEGMVRFLSGEPNAPSGEGEGEQV